MALNIVAAVLARAVVGSWASANKPKLAGHFLTPHELGDIDSVACLEARQKDPAVRCDDLSMSKSRMVSAFRGHITSASYPNYKNRMCNSQGDFLCDPETHASMGLVGQQQLARNLRRARERTAVQCGRLLNDPVDPRHMQPFYLGVAILPDWPTGNSDPDSLEQLGQMIASDWNMDELFTGSPQPYLRCPNTAVLLLLPQAGTAFLSSVSCEFICASKGGAQVVAAAQAAMQANDTLAGALAAIHEVYSFLGKEPQVGQADKAAKVPKPSDANVQHGFFITNFLQRVLFGLACLGLVASLALGMMVLLIGPGVLAPLRK